MSKIQLSPYVNFGGRAKEAMDFYQHVLGGRVELLSLDEKGAPKPAGSGDSVMLARLDADGAMIVGTDGHPKYPAKVGENMAIALRGTDKDRITKIFTSLAEGGVLKSPLTKQPWGSEDGWLTDKFGINWTISVGHE